MVMNKLRLNKNIYDQSYIQLAIHAFEDLCTIIFKDEEKYYTCLFNDCKYDIKETKKEFENYLIDLINSNSSI